MSKALWIGILLGLCVSLLSASRPQQLSLQDRVTKNEIYLEALTARVVALERGGSTLATLSARDIAVLQQQVLETNQHLDKLERFIAWQTASVLGIFFGVVALGIRAWIDSKRK